MKNYYHILNKKKGGHVCHRAEGFTIVEFVVIIIIFAVIATVSLFNFRGFTRRVRVENLAQNIAVAIHSAQVLGSTQTAGELNTAADIRFTGYVGVYFPYSSGSFGVGNLPDGTPVANAFVVFQDNTEYSATTDPFLDSSDDRIQDVLRLDGSDQIVSIFAGEDEGNISAVTADFYITFKRPSLSAMMYDAQGEHYQYAQILVQTSADEQRIIKITAGGQISVASVVQ